MCYSCVLAVVTLVWILNLTKHTMKKETESNFCPTRGHTFPTSFSWHYWNTLLWYLPPYMTSKKLFGHGHFSCCSCSYYTFIVLQLKTALSSLALSRPINTHYYKFAHIITNITKEIPFLMICVW